MNKTILALALLGACTIQSASIAGTAKPTKFDASLDGYCDVFTLKENAWEVYGKHSGCDKAATIIGTVNVIEGLTYIQTNYPEPHNKTSFLIFFTPPKHGAGNWYIYESDGKTFVEDNSGTYSKPTPEQAAANSDKPSALHDRP